MKEILLVFMMTMDTIRESKVRILAPIGVIDHFFDDDDEEGAVGFSLSKSSVG